MNERLMGQMHTWGFRAFMLFAVIFTAGVFATGIKLMWHVWSSL